MSVDDPVEKLREMMSTKEGQENIMKIGRMLGLSPDSPNQQNGNSSSNQGGIDFNALSSLIGNLGKSGDASSKQNSGGIDMSALSSLIGNLGHSGDNSSAKSGNGIDMSALSALMGNLGNSKDDSQKQSGSSVPDPSGIDVGAIMKIREMMQAMNTENKNTELIRALKPHLKPERQKKADEALRFMQLLSVLPLLRDSGIFGNLFG